MEMFYNILWDAWLVMEAMAPYILFGFAVAGILSVVLNEEWMQKHLGGDGLASVAKASLFGVPLPLCSCGVIPVAASLKKSGASRGAVTSFLISTPQTGVDSIAVTYGLLGPVFAIFRAVAAFVMGVVGGGIVSLVDEKNEKVSDSSGKPSCSCCHEDQHGNLPPWPKRAIRHGFIALPQDFAVEMMVGILISGLITAVVPAGAFEEKIGSGLVGILIMMALGIPFYICSTASVPMAFGLLAGGVSPGAVLAFLITGPATNAATIVTMRKVLGNKTVIIYLATIAGGAIACGLLMDGLLKSAMVESAMPHHVMEESSWLGLISGIILTAILVNGAWQKYKPAKKHSGSCH